MNGKSIWQQRNVMGKTALLAAVLMLLGTAGPAPAQPADTVATDSVAADTTARTPAPPVRMEGGGRATLIDWPASLARLLDEMGRDAPYLLPNIDSLALDYRYAAGDSTSRWSFVLGWRPGAQVLYRGDVLPRRRAPDGIRMVNVELRAQVRAGGERVGDMIVAVDSMALAPFPSIYAFEVTVRHERLLLDAPAETARRALRRGLTLDSLVVERMGFASGADDRTRQGDAGGRSPDTRERRPDPPRGPSVYEPSTRIFIGWRVAPRPYYVGSNRGGGRTVEPRTDGVGRQPAAGEARPTADRGRAGEGDDPAGGQGRGEQGAQDRGDARDGERAGRAEGAGRRSGDSKSEDDDDDETSLRLPALAAAAAVGLVAYAGGTLGVYGRGDTPIGLAAGYTRAKGGVQLQAAVNGAVIENDAGQKLTLKALGFYDVFSAPVQPAVGLGLQIDPQREGDVVPSASVGLALNLERVVVLGGVDVVQGTPEVGITYNFRYGDENGDEEGP